MAATEWAWRVLSAGILFSTTACQPMADVPLSQNELTTSTEDARSFQDDVEFLGRHMELVILRRADSLAQVAVCLLYTSPSPRDS